MSPQLRWLLAVVALVGSLTTVLARAAAGPQPDFSAFRQELSRRLESMGDAQLTDLERALPPLSSSNVDGEPPADPFQDQDMMMGDMPAPADDHGVTVQPDDLLKITRESTESVFTEDEYGNSTKPNKNQRLTNIKEQILKYIGVGGRVPPPSPMVKSNPNVPPPLYPIDQNDVLQKLLKIGSVPDGYPFDTFTRKTQSFYPVCGLPKHTNERDWYSSESMNIMFNISVPKPSSNDSTVNISMATLRLYKQLINCTSQSSNETTDGCSPTSSEETTSKRSTSMEVPVTMMEDRQIRVSVYVYTRTLKKRKMRRRLLDSRMVPYYSEKWTEWNIRTAVKNWRQDPSRNFGLNVEVEDEDGNVLPIERFFKPMNCSPDIMQMATPRPIPGFLVEYGFTISGGMINGTTNASSLNPVEALYSNAYRYPMLDLSTIEVPNAEMPHKPLSSNARQTVVRQLGGGGPRSLRKRPEHSIRHRDSANHYEPERKDRTAVTQRNATPQPDDDNDEDASY